MPHTNTGNTKERKLTTLETLGTEIYKLIWKYGLWMLVLMFTVGSRLFYEMIYNPEVSIRKLLALAGLSTSVGSLAIIWCASMGFGGWSIAIVMIAGLAAYRLVEYFVSMDKEVVGVWFRKLLTSAINSLPGKDNK